MKSFRLKFIDQDDSFTTSTEVSTIKGFMVVRSPKGTTEATYYPYGNEKAINAYVGLPTANWPDLYEAVAFNNYYGLYISSPAGTSKEYPSYYGGVYLTTKGLFNYWRVDDADNPSYEIELYPGSENVNYDVHDSEMSIVKVNTTSDEQGIISITGIDAQVIQRTSYFNMKCWADSSTGIEDGQEVSYHLVNGSIYPVIDDEDSDIKVGYYTLTDDGTYTLILGATGSDGNGYISANNSANTPDIPFIDFTKIFDYSALSSTTPEGTVTLDSIIMAEDTSAEPISGTNLISKLLLDGTGSKFALKKSSSDDTNKFYSPFMGLSTRIYWRLNVKSDTFLCVSQTSPNETPTSITISNIGYDKYLYDCNVRYILKDDFEGYIGNSGSHVLGIREQGGSFADNPRTKSNVQLDDFIQQLFASNAEGIIDVVSSYDEQSWTAPFNEKLHSLWQYNTTTGLWTDITNTMKTKKFFIEGPLLNGSGVAYSDDLSPEYGGLGYVNSNCTYSIWTIQDTSTAGKYKHKSFRNEKTGTYELKKDVRYNTITISCKEEVYPGSYTDGGEYTGSLSETGVDASGSKIYFPNIVPKTDTFIKVIPVHTFDELGVMNTEGFFTGEKIVDPIGPAIDIYSFTIKGQRFCKHVNDENVKNGVLGCTWCDDYYQIIKDGLIEAQSEIYDDAYVIMEPTGQETFKADLMALRVTFHELSTIISPKIITKTEFDNPATIAVAGRSRGTAQYIGEFKMYDTYTGKYYWCQPIGDIGAMLCRIIDKKLGGIAPAGTNDSAGLGGVLPRAVLAAKWNFKDAALETLEKKALNPIIYNADYGLMIMGQRSTQDPDSVTDWSYLGHSMSFDLCKREIRDNVMTQQVFKRISDYWFNIREKQVQAILDKRITGKDPIWASATVDISGVNTPQTMSQRKFMITVKIKVYVYSEYVVLTFNNLAQE